MVKKIELKAEKREGGKQVLKAVRQKSSIPAVLYGQGGDATTLMIDENEFTHVYEKAGESSLIDLKIGNDSPIKTIIKDIQKNPVKNYITHVDLYKIDMKQPIETEIPIHFEGESVAEHQLGGTLVKSLETISVKCLPSDLVEFFSVDLANLKTFDDVIRISDIGTKEGVEILLNPESVIVNVTPPKVEEEPVVEAVPEAGKQADSSEDTPNENK